MFTDKKITPRTKNRKSYYAPTERDVQCPNLLLNADDTITIAPDDTDPFTVRKIRRCFCTESTPFCSYHLGDGNMVTITHPDGTTSDVLQNFCHRYEFLQEKDTEPADTHNKVFRIVNGKLTWV